MKNYLITCMHLQQKWNNDLHEKLTLLFYYQEQLYLSDKALLDLYQIYVHGIFPSVEA